MIQDVYYVVSHIVLCLLLVFFVGLAILAIIWSRVLLELTQASL